MQLKIIGTGSKGNAYILENENEALLIECGIGIKEIKQALGFNLNKVRGCMVTHEHMDHARSINDVMNLGINVYATKGTFDMTVIPKRGQRRVEIQNRVTYAVGGFRVMPFDIKHDAEEPVGFLISHEDCGKVLFLTDTCYCEYTFPGLNNVIIEANFSQAIIDKKYGRDSEKEFLRNRILRSHFSLEHCMGLLKANDLSYVNNIVLIHLSDTNSDEVQFKKEVEKLTGKNVVVAGNNMIVKFDKTPF